MIARYWMWRRAMRKANAWTASTGRRTQVRKGVAHIGPWPLECWIVSEVGA
jgi:hypothetical protein